MLHKNQERTVKTRADSSKEALYSSQKGHIGQSEINSKKALSQIEPRITRRMKKMANSLTSGQQRCAICLGDCQKDYGKLTCSHTFCLQCVIKWWKSHPTCPYCREKIEYVTTNQKKTIRFEDLKWQIIEEDDQHFIPHCELCWGEIELFESMNICTECRSVYWHSNCLPFSNNKWYCVECANKNDEEQ